MTKLKQITAALAFASLSGMALAANPLSVHILDLQSGQPTAGVTVTLERPLKGNEAVLAVTDNGVGMSETPSGGMGLGTRLIAGLTAQLQGKQTVTRDNGVRFELTFPVGR